jgi:hypothetical protein
MNSENFKTMKKIAVLIISACLFLIIGCEKDETLESSPIASFTLNNNDCVTTIEQSTICFDSVLNDSRCAIGANCKWEGNATVIFNFTTFEGINYKFELNTNSEFPIDTVIENIYILMTDLKPNPELNTEIQLKDYEANLTVANIKSIKSNATIIDFNPDKCGCCWGWTIKIGNDTIKSDDTIIGKTIGYKIDYPINVYAEKGSLKQSCSELGGYDYYELKHIIKVP